MHYASIVLFSSVQLYLLNAGSKNVIEVTVYINEAIIMILFLAPVLYHLYKECALKYYLKCKQRIVLEQNEIFDENDENLASYPPRNDIKAVPTFTVIEKSIHDENFQGFDINTDCNNKQVQWSNPNTIAKSDTVSLLSPDS